MGEADRRSLPMSMWDRLEIFTSEWVGQIQIFTSEWVGVGGVERSLPVSEAD